MAIGLIIAIVHSKTPPEVPQAKTIYTNQLHAPAVFTHLPYAPVVYQSFLPQIYANQPHFPIIYKRPPAPHAPVVYSNSNNQEDPAKSRSDPATVAPNSAAGNDCKNQAGQIVPCAHVVYNNSRSQEDPPSVAPYNAAGDVCKNQAGQTVPCAKGVAPGSPHFFYSAESRSGSSFCDSTVTTLLSTTGAVVSNVPGVSTFMTLFNIIRTQSCAGSGVEEAIREVATTEDRKQEARNFASALKAHLLTINEIKSYTDLKKTSYETLRINIRTDRTKCFDNFEHHHPSKYRLLTEYASVELALLDMMIISNSGEYKKTLERAYGDALLYYIKKGGEMAIKLPLKVFHEEGILGSS